jgi:hypothetical protein
MRHTAIQKSIGHLAALIDEIRPERSISPPKENLTAIVLRLDIGAESILLGSDMENSNVYGWSVIQADPRHNTRKSFVFKVAHHGGASGHDDGTWSTLLHDKPFAFLSPFHHGKQDLPKRDDVKRIKNLTDKGYITKEPTWTPRSRKRDAGIERTLRESGIIIWSASVAPGHVRFRFSPGNTATHRVDVFEGARVL